MAPLQNKSARRLDRVNPEGRCSSLSILSISAQVHAGPLANCRVRAPRAGPPGRGPPRGCWRMANLPTFSVSEWIVTTTGPALRARGFRPRTWTRQYPYCGETQFSRLRPARRARTRSKRRGWTPSGTNSTASRAKSDMATPESVTRGMSPMIRALHRLEDRRAVVLAPAFVPRHGERPRIRPLRRPPAPKPLAGDSGRLPANPGP